MRGDVFPNPAKYDFPDWTAIGPYLIRSSDVVSFGVPLTLTNVREAYHKGIFPWFTEGLPLPWHCPEWRAVLELDKLRITRSLAKFRRKSEFTFSIDRAFERVMRECARSFRPGQMGTWITPDFERVYGELHRMGMVHSVEVWNDRDELVGGLYGVDAGGVFCGESMFYIEPNASKLAFIYLVEHLRSRGAIWLDCQVMTDHLASLGASEIPRQEFLARLKATQAEGLNLFG